MDYFESSEQISLYEPELLQETRENLRKSLIYVATENLGEHYVHGKGATGDQGRLL